MSKLYCLLAAQLTALCVFAQNPPPDSFSDPAFAQIPFDRWLTESGQSHFQWSAKVSGVRLANSQRLEARVDIVIDGNELAHRRSPKGELALFIQFSDGDHRVFQSHGAVELKIATEEAAKSNYIYSQSAFVTPGDYRVDIAMLDTNSSEHATLTRSLHVAPLKNDPLPDAMTGLPGVEYAQGEDPPDLWFQPQLTGLLHLPVETKRPVPIEVLANASPSSIGPRFRSGELNSRILADLLPGLKVISQIHLSQGEMNVSMIDLTRRQVLFQQKKVDPKTQFLDWPKLRPALLQADPNKIDVHELTDSHQNPQFFVEQVRRRVKDDGALIILSGPIAFAQSDDRRPIELEGLANGRVFYLRFHPLPVRRDIDERVGRVNRRRGGLIGSGGSALLAQEPPDSLTALLKPLLPHIYDVYSPEQFRKALAEIMREISQL
jgi:hypothetical protein